MASKKAGRSNKSSLDSFFAFWSTLPGVLTGIAALIAAVTGLYLAFDNGRIAIPEPSPTPSASATPTGITQGVWDKCFQPEFAGVTPIEEGTGEHFPKLQAGLVRIMLMYHHQPLGAVVVRHYADDDHFEVEKLTDSKCGPIEVEDPKLINDAWLKVAFGGQKYELRLMYHGRFSTEFVKS